MAVAKQLGAATRQIQRQATLTAENRSLRAQLRVESELVGSSETMQNIETQIGETCGDDLRAAVMAVLPHLGYEYARTATVKFCELVRERFHFLYDGRVFHLA